MLERGETSIAALALGAPRITPANSLVIAAALPGKSKRDLQLFLSRVSPDGSMLDAEETIEIKVALTRSELEILERAVEVLSARGKVPSKKEALMKGLDLLVKAKDPVVAAERAEARAERVVQKAQNPAPGQTDQAGGRSHKRESIQGPDLRSVEHSRPEKISFPVVVVVSVSLNVSVDHLTTDTQTVSYKGLDVSQSSIQFLARTGSMLARMCR